MNLSIRLIVAFVAVLAFSAEAGYINAKTVTFTENVTVQGRRAVFDYTGQLVSDNEIRFKREAGANPAVEFVATRVGGP